MGLRGGGVRALQNKGHAHLQYSVAVFLGGCMHSSHYTVGWSAPELGWVFWKKKKIAAFARNRLASSFLPRIICYFALLTGVYP